MRSRIGVQVLKLPKSIRLSGNETYKPDLRFLYGTVKTAKCSS